MCEDAPPKRRRGRPRGKVLKVPICVMVPAELVKDLDRRLESEGISKSAQVEKALEAYFLKGE